MLLAGIAADHGGFELKSELSESLRAAGYEIKDYGAYEFDSADDYPDFIIPLARAVASAARVIGVSDRTSPIASWSASISSAVTSK